MNKAGITRKQFLKAVGLGAGALLCPYPASAFWGKTSRPWKNIRGRVFRGDAPDRPWKWSIEGFHYASNGRDVQCQICPNRCYLRPGDRSLCRSKVNIEGRLYSLAYGNPCAVHVDPIEKKPLFHFHPTTSIFSIATTGCNFRCLNCQNWQISQRKPEEVRSVELFPPQVVQEARRQGVAAIAYTYSEAITFYEYMFDTAKQARKASLKNVLVSNGYINQEPLLKLCQYIDGANINLKSFDDRIYQCLNGGTLRPVLDTLKTLHHQGVWLEITTLVVPTYVDDPEMIREMCRWIVKELGPDHPLHLLRFFPHYKLTHLPPTPVKTLERLREVALGEGLHHVYLGNVPGHPASHTYCPKCQELLVERRGYFVRLHALEAGHCKACGRPVSGRWS